MTLIDFLTESVSVLAVTVVVVFVSARLREHVKVALTGDGGDEVFGGYPRFWQAPAPIAQSRSRLPPTNTVARLQLRSPWMMEPARPTLRSTSR